MDEIVGQDDPKEPWWTLALCSQTDPELFFPDRGETARSAIRVCASCPVQRECLVKAMAEEAERTGERRFGIRGGIPPRTREAIAAGSLSIDDALAGA
ncbi:WhiB family transcriptional regulator [Membranihabitans marinus]